MVEYGSDSSFVIWFAKIEILAPLHVFHIRVNDSI